MTELPIYVMTKFLVGNSLEQMAAKLAPLQLDGVDFLIRDGYPLAPDEVTPAKLKEIVEQFEMVGLSVPMIEHDMTDPDSNITKRIYEASAECGIKQMRLGLQQYDRNKSYQENFDRVRRRIAGFEELGRKYSVRGFFQQHGGSLYASASGMAMVLNGFDPKYVGFYADPGNQVAQEGRELPEVTFEVAREYLSFVGVKNAIITRNDGKWEGLWAPLPDGAVNWKEIVSHLDKIGYEGPLGLHGYYMNRDQEQILAQIESDLKYLRSLISKANKKIIKL
ncbi:sugar phosphate isomerase/epimerase family protein [Bacillus sp. FSL K6-3431]|uniref:sugar phosphate isomerase/epimerase family protein n=1 Tax=Bacillus sp. FSL K6-3431 TaxID=2921500 RepID=UPI0030FA2478